MPQLPRSESASAGSGFSWKPWMRPSSSVITTPNSLGVVDPLGRQRGDPAVATRGPRAARVRSMSVSASPEMTRKRVAEEVADVAHAAGGAQQLAPRGCRRARRRTPTRRRTAADQVREVVQVRDHVVEAVPRQQAQDVLHHRPAEDRHHRLRHLVGERPQPGAEPRRQHHRLHRPQRSPPAGIRCPGPSSRGTSPAPR